MSGLPEGLITNTDTIRGDIQQVDRVVDEDIAQLWRVYSTNQRLLAKNTGRRLENLFWRIWSNNRLRNDIRGSQIAFLFHGISEGDSIIRTTPVQSRRRDSSSVQALGDAEPLISTREKTARFLKLTESTPQARSALVTTEHYQTRAVKDSETSFTERRREAARRSRPPPILKKTRGNSSNQLSKTARILTPTWKTEKEESQEEAEPNESAIVSPSVASDSQSSPNPPIPQVMVDETLYNDEGIPPSNLSTIKERSPTPSAKSGENPSLAKSKSKKSAFMASTASSKRRPQLTRRKSSNSSGPPPKAPAPAPAPRVLPPDMAPTQSVPPKSSLLSPLKGLQENALLPRIPPKVDFTDYRPAQFERPPSRSPKPPSARSSRSASPVLSRPSTEHSAYATRDDGSTGTQSWLVDVDFKAKFASKLRQQVETQKPFSTVRSGVPSPSASRQRESRIQGREKGAAMLGANGEADEELRESTSAIQSSDDEEGDEEDSVTAVPTALQKTKSQLTLLLNTERRREKEREKRGKNSRG